MNYKQFDIYNIDLNPIKGSEQKGERPCLILQTNAVSHLGRTTLIAPLTTKKIENIYPYEVEIIPSIINNLTEISKVKLDQIRVIDKTRIQEKIGTLEETYHNNIFEALDIIVDKKGYFR